VPATVIERPIWRRFLPRFADRAAEHVRSGGHAAVVHGDRHVEMLLSVDDAGRITELGLWALFAIEQRRWRRVKAGVARGLATARVRRDFVEVVLDWCERDAVHPGPTRALPLDCIACAACCHEANVIVDEADFERFRAAGRPELARPPYVRRAADGVITLRFLPNGRCRHLQQNRKCAVYAARPDNCRAFVAGSEACLAAREDTLGYRDG
jgi:hypothetical protein